MKQKFQKAKGNQTKEAMGKEKKSKITFKVIYTMKELDEPVEVRYDDRLVPHIFAHNNKDVIFIQGYLHAKFRLWQMDMTTRLASGRLSEVAGIKTLAIDREMRRKGMVYGAENSLKTMEADPESKQTLDAYRAHQEAETAKQRGER